MCHTQSAITGSRIICKGGIRYFKQVGDVPTMTASGYLVHRLFHLRYRQTVELRSSRGLPRLCRVLPFGVLPKNQARQLTVSSSAFPIHDNRVCTIVYSACYASTSAAMLRVNRVSLPSATVARNDIGRGDIGIRVSGSYHTACAENGCLELVAHSGKLNTVLTPLAGIARRILGLPVRFTPYAVQRPVLELTLNEIFKVQRMDGDLEFLSGRSVAVCFTDLGRTWLFGFGNRRLKTLSLDRRADVKISGTLASFMLLAAQSVDPDTLFFQRRLAIEGDTELGLFVKNLLDSTDWSSIPESVRNGLASIGGAQVSV